MKQVFIGGTGRSGTTILKRVLANHSRVASLPCELRVIVDPDGALDLVSELSHRWSPYRSDLAIHRFRTLMRRCGAASSALGLFIENKIRRVSRSLGLSLQPYLGIGLGYYFGHAFYEQRVDDLLQELCHDVASASWFGSPPQLQSKLYESGPIARDVAEELLARFFDDLYGNIARGGEDYWIEDTPTNLLHAAELHRLFPDMYFIHIYRDPRDVVASYRTKTWGGTDFQVIAQRVSGMYKRWITERQQLPNSKVCEVCLEQMAQNPRKELSKLCRSIGLPFEDNLLQIPLNKVNAGRHQQDIPSESLVVVEEILGEYISAYGYEA